jgi:hypothetical protein
MRGVVRPFALALAVLAVLCQDPARAQTAQQDARLPPVDELVRYFDTIVFGSELDPRLASTVVAKWQDETIGISVQGRATRQLESFAENHLETLARLTGLRFARVKPTATVPKIDLIFVRRAEMANIQVGGEAQEFLRKAAAHGGCYFLTWKQPPSRIVRSIVVVNIERDPAVTNSCILEELTQSLGLPNDSDALRPSIFSDRDRLYELSPADAILVRTLYDPRMKAGLGRAEASRVARRIIGELAAGR